MAPTGRRAYLTPHPTYAPRTAVLVFARELPAGPGGPVADLQHRVHQGLAALASRPVRIAWADQDAVLTTSALDRFREDFPRAEVLRLPDSGHFLQEDAHEQIVPALLDFLRRQHDGLGESAPL